MDSTGGTDRGPGRPARLTAAIDVLALALIFIALPAVFSAGGMTNLIGAALPVIILAAVWLRIVSLGKGWADFGLRRPARWNRVLQWALGLLAVNLMLGLAGGTILHELGLELPDISRFDYIRGNLPALVTTLVLVWVTAGFLEEMIFRGFLQARLETALGVAAAAPWLAAVLQGVLFGLLHAYQGVSGVVLTGLIGVIFGIGFVWLGRNLWPLIIAHGLTDTLSLMAVYAGFAGP